MPRSPLRVADSFMFEPRSWYRARVATGGGRVRRVRGTLFVDYVRMIRGNKAVDWTAYLEPEDVAFLEADTKIDPQGWYPMETFERLGVAIVREVARGQLGAVQMWGRFQVATVVKAFPALVAAGQPRETLMRFHALHRSFFDYDAVVVEEALDDSARVHIQYEMGAEAEEAACHQTLGFFEQLVEVSGGRDVSAKLQRRSWDGADRTLVVLAWVCPA
jgi:uncharacterized protein (TIGR02265 family)